MFKKFEGKVKITEQNLFLIGPVDGLSIISD